MSNSWQDYIGDAYKQEEDGLKKGNSIKIIYFTISELHEVVSRKVKKDKNISVKQVESAIVHKHIEEELNKNL